MEKIELFKECTITEGYNLAVRDSWNYKIKRIHISITEKEGYFEEFGNEVVFEDVFFDWWCKFNKVGKYVSSQQLLYFYCTELLSIYFQQIFWIVHTKHRTHKKRQIEQKQWQIKMKDLYRI